MAFVCPECGSKGLEIAHALELAPDGYDDEITLQTVACARCGLRAVAVYRESRRGALTGEAWRHEGFRVTEDDFAAIDELMKGCPAPSDSRCGCRGHTTLGQKSGHRWDGLNKSGIRVWGDFEMR